MSKQSAVSGPITIAATVLVLAMVSVVLLVLGVV